MIFLFELVPANWRTSTSLESLNKEFVEACLTSFDAISPWTVGSYDIDPSVDELANPTMAMEEFANETNATEKFANETNAMEEFANETIAGDVQLINDYNNQNWWKFWKGDLGYIPVVFPGWSGHNLSDGKERSDFNRNMRERGRFLWRQIVNAKKHGARTIYAATWDG